MLKVKQNGEKVNRSSFLDRLKEKTRKFLREMGAFDETDFSPARPSNRRESQLIERELRKNEVKRYMNARERAQNNRRKSRQRNARYISKLRSRYPKGEPPRFIPSKVWTMASDILADQTGKASIKYLSGCSNRTAVNAIRKAAQPIDESTGEVLRNLSNERSRRIVALGLSMLALGNSTRRKGPWKLLVRGIPQGAFTALLRNPYTGERPGISAINGIHSADDSLDGGQLGYLRALERAGFCYSQQLPITEVGPNEAYGTHALNRYWIVGPFAFASKPDEITMAEMVLLEAAQELSISSHISRTPYVTKDAQIIGVEPIPDG
jgi:hypothetical protein